ncbi:hypothetical protein ACGFXC_06750 [Streptomyces sp. NPDC048507]|uniref:hypothetical protein n=1 Tax=Streptomyces sp. NPDC048507 TaxID=3365560 RepID=UPI003713C396
MSGEHARPTSTLFPSAPQDETAAPAHAARRRHAFRRRLRRRILAYSGIEFLAPEPSALPGTGTGTGPGEECLLLLHSGGVVGRVRYHLCAACAEGVITGVEIDASFRSTGLDTRALSHLRASHPGVAWRSTLTRRTTRDLLRRMRIPASVPGAPGSVCPHLPDTAAGAARAAR